MSGLPADFITGVVAALTTAAEIDALQIWLY